VANKLGVQPSTIYAMLSRGEIQAHHYGKRRYFTQSQLNAALMKRNRVDLIDMTYACGPKMKLS